MVSRLASALISCVLNDQQSPERTGLSHDLCRLLSFLLIHLGTRYILQKVEPFFIADIGQMSDLPCQSCHLLACSSAELTRPCGTM
jgi:hypothetical protein